jgi:hypothetical protein
MNSAKYSTQFQVEALVVVQLVFSEVRNTHLSSLKNTYHENPGSLKMIGRMTSADTSYLKPMSILLLISVSYFNYIINFLTFLVLSSLMRNGLRMRISLN